MTSERWYLVLKHTAVFMVDASFTRTEMENKLMEMDDPDKYEIIDTEEVYRRIKA